MAKLKTAFSLLGSFKEVRSIRAEFDNPSHMLSADDLFPPEEVRPAPSKARTLLLHVTDGTSGEGDLFTIAHTPATSDSISVIVFNPNTLIEAGSSFRELIRDYGYPVGVAIVEDILGVRVDQFVPSAKSKVSSENATRL